MTDKQISFTTQMMNDNFAHARHVESERMTLMSIFIAIISASLALLSKITPGVLSLVILAILICFSFVVRTLIRRWNSLFTTHWSKARELYGKLREAICEEDAAAVEANINRYFCFNNSANSDVRRYIHTSSLFILIITIVQILLAVLFLTWLLLFLSTLGLPYLENAGWLRALSGM